MKKCPYAVHRISQTRTVYEYDDEGVETASTQTTVNSALFCKCHEENCGAYNKTTANYSA